jgi:hypothetical protein
MSLIEEVKLGVGEDQLLLPLVGKPLEVLISKNHILKEVKKVNGLTYVASSQNHPNNSDERPFYLHSQVIVFNPTRAPLINADYMGKGPLPKLDEFIINILNDSQKKVGIPPYINGFSVFNKASHEDKEKVGNGHDHITVSSRGHFEIMLVRYVPASPENKKAMEAIFGKYLF